MEKSAKKLEKRALASGVDLKLSKSDVLAYDVSASDEDGKYTQSSAYNEFRYNERVPLAKEVSIIDINAKIFSYYKYTGSRLQRAI